MSVGKIQRNPLGFLKFLGMVGTGRHPTDMADDVRSVIDLLPFYGTSILESRTITAAAGATAVGDFLDLTVPQNEQWLVLACRYGIQALTTEQVKLSCVVTPNAGGACHVDVTPLMTAVAAIANLIGSFRFPQPILLSAGMSISGNIDDLNVAAARQFRVQALAYIIKA